MNQDITEKKPSEPLLEPKNAKSKGERVFDRLVYGGLAGVVTFLLTVPVTYLLKHHWKVKPHFDGAVESLHRGISKIYPAIGHKTSDTILTTFALMQGGNLMLLPIAWAEKHKTKIVGGLNVMLGDKTPPEQTTQAPQQTLWSLVQSRLMAFAAVFTALKGAEMAVPNTLKTFEDEVGKRMCQLFEKPVERVGVVIEKGMPMRGVVPSKTYLFGKIGALDIFATAAAATLLYVGGHFFARKQAEKKSGNVTEAKRRGVPLMRSDAQAEPELQAGMVTTVAGEKAHHGTLISRAAEQQLS